MSQKQDNLIVVLDIGSAYTRVLAADLNEGALRFRGYGMVESAGMRKGLIAEDKTTKKLAFGVVADAYRRLAGNA